MQTSQRPRRGYRWPPVAPAPGSLTENSCTLIPGLPGSPPLPRQISPPEYAGAEAGCRACGFHVEPPHQRHPAGWPDRRRDYRACRRPGRVGLPAWRWRRPQTDAARAMPPDPPRAARAAQLLPKAPRTPPKTSPPSSTASKGEPAAAPVRPLHTPHNRQAGHARQAGEAHRPPCAATAVAPRAAVAGHACAAGLGGCRRGGRRLPGRRRQWLTLPPAALGVRGGARLVPRPVPHRPTARRGRTRLHAPARGSGDWRRGAAASLRQVSHGGGLRPGVVRT